MLGIPVNLAALKPSAAPTRPVRVFVAFAGPADDEANKHLEPHCRKPFVIPGEV